MNGFFNMDSPVMRFLNRFADLIWINVLTLFLMIPVVTGGAALTAMHYVFLKLVRGEESYITKMYFHSFKDNFKQATIIWLICLVAFAVFGIDLYLVFWGSTPFPVPMKYAMFTAVVFCFGIYQWIFPILSHFVGTIPGTFKNALIMAFAGFPRTLGMVIISAIPAVVMYFGSLRILPLFILFGITAPGYACALLYSSFFKKFEPEEEDEDPDAMPEELMNYNPETAENTADSTADAVVSGQDAEN